MDSLDLLLIGAATAAAWWMMNDQKRSSIGYDVPFGSMFQKAEAQFSLPKFLLVEVARKESNFKRDAFNKKSGASGIMQIVPKWHPNVDPWAPEQAIPYAAGYLSQLYVQFGSWMEALAAYNWGPGNLNRYGLDRLPLETSNYVGTIQQRLREQGTIIS